MQLSHACRAVLCVFLLAPVLCTPLHKLMLHVNKAALISWANLPPSSHQCHGESFANRTCILSNVAVWQGKVYYWAADGSNSTIPPVRLDEMMPVNESEPQLALTDLMHVSPHGHNRLPFRLPVTAVRRYKIGILFWRRHTYNWFHLLNEAAPNMYMRLCRAFGLCSYRDVDPADLLPLWIDNSVHLGTISTARELWSCFASQTEPLATTSARELILVERLLVGSGPECFPQHCYLDAGYNLKEEVHPASPNHVRGFVRLMRQCTGAPERDYVLHPRPRVLFVNRRYEDGRSVVNAPEAFAKLQQLKEDEGLCMELSMTYLAGMTMARQARQFASSDVVVMNHGSAQADLLFLPPRALVIDVAASEGQQLAADWAVDVLAPALDLSAMHLKLDEEADTVWLLERVPIEAPDFPAWTPQDQAALLVNRTCPGRPTLLPCPEYNLWSRALNLKADVNVLVETVRQGVIAWAAAHPAAAAAAASQECRLTW